MSPSIAKSLPRIFFWQLLTVGVGMVVQIMLARFLGPHDKGIVDLFLLIPVMLASATDIGLLPANTYFAGKKTIPIHVLHTNSVVWSFVVGIVLTGAAIVVGIFHGSLFASLSRLWFILAVATTLPSLYFSLWTGLMYGGDNADAVYAVGGIVAILSMVAYGAGIFLHWGLGAFIQITAAVLFLKGVIGWMVFQRRTEGPWEISVTAYKQSLMYGVALFVGILINMLHFRLVQFYVESMLGPAALGQFAIAVRFAEMIWLLDFPIINASLFKLTSSGREDSILLAQTMTRTIGVIIFLAAGAIGLFAPFVIPLLFGDRFAPSVVPLLLLLPGVLGWSLARSLSQFVAYQMGKPWYNTAAAVLVLGFNVVLILVLVPRWGIAGASVASSISYLSMLVILTTIFLRMSGARFWPTFVAQKSDLVLLRKEILNKLPLTMVKWWA